MSSPSPLFHEAVQHLAELDPHVIAARAAAPAGRPVRRRRPLFRRHRPRFA
jgi:hypothetical protein